MLEMKSMVSTILRNFVIHSGGPENDVVLIAETVLSSKNGVKLKLTPRVWWMYFYYLPSVCIFFYNFVHLNVNIIKNKGKCYKVALFCYFKLHNSNLFWKILSNFRVKSRWKYINLHSTHFKLILSNSSVNGNISQ